jgi:hypothetical protein
MITITNKQDSLAFGQGVVHTARYSAGGALDVNKYGNLLAEKDNLRKEDMFKIGSDG